MIGLHLLLTALITFLPKATHNLVEREVWKSYFHKSAWIALISCPIIIYTGFVSLTDPFMKSWTSQNLILSPNFLHYLVAFGLVFPFALFGVYRLIKADVWRGIFLGGWVFSLPILAYAPFNLQRRLPEGIWVALIILALYFFGTIPTRLNRRFNWTFLLLVPTTLIFIIGSLGAVSQNKPPLFRPADEVAAFNS